MKYLIWFSSLAFAATLGSVYAADDIDFAQVNPVLQTLANEVLVGDDQMEWVYPTFDTTFSSMQTERLKYDVHASMTNTKWAQSSHTTIDDWVKLVADRDPAHLGIGFSSASTVKLDTLAFARYAGLVSLRESCCHNPNFQDRIVGNLQRLSTVGSLDDLYLLLYSGNQLAMDIVAAHVAEETQGLNCLKAHTCGADPTFGGNPSWEQQEAWAQREIDQWQTLLNAYKSIQLTTTVANGKVTAIHVSFPNGVQFLSRIEAVIQPGAGQINILADAMNATVDGFSPLQQADMDRLKKGLNDTLVGATSGSTADQNAVQASYRQALIDFKKTINGQRHY
jgi:hypothetical protein